MVKKDKCLSNLPRAKYCTVLTVPHAFCMAPPTALQVRYRTPAVPCTEEEAAAWPGEVPGPRSQALFLCYNVGSENDVANDTKLLIARHKIPFRLAWMSGGLWS